MNRRGFLGAIFAEVAAALVPALAGAKQSIAAARGFVGWKMCSTAVVLNEAWVCMVHPDCERDIRTLAARDKWKNAYRQARKTRFLGSPQEILAGYKPDVTPAEVGAIEGIRFTGRGFT